MSRTADRQKRVGSFMIMMGVIAIAAAAALVLFNLFDGERAREASEGILGRLDPVISAAASGEHTGEEDGSTESDIETFPSDGTVGKMPTVLIDGIAYIGEIEIPSLQIRLPVMETWDYDKLKISPCRYTGSYMTDDLVICGHNYLRHFSPIKWIDIGAEVNLITADGQVIRYIVSNRETVQPTDIRKMICNDNSTQDAESGNHWDLTLFTCNTGGQTRCAVRCIRTEGMTEHTGDKAI